MNDSALCDREKKPSRRIAELRSLLLETTTAVTVKKRRFVHDRSRRDANEQSAKATNRFYVPEGRAPVKKFLLTNLVFFRFQPALFSSTAGECRNCVVCVGEPKKLQDNATGGGSSPPP